MDGESDEEIAPLKRRRKGSKTPVRASANRIITDKTTAVRNKKRQTVLMASPTKISYEGATLHHTPPKTKLKQLAKVLSGEMKRSPGRASASGSDTELSSSQEKQLFASSNNKGTMQFLSVRSDLLGLNKYDVCPVCCINLNFLHGVSPNLHINQCLDKNPEFEKGCCSADSSCSLSSEKHFREYKHTPKTKSNAETSETSETSDVDTFNLRRDRYFESETVADGSDPSHAEKKFTLNTDTGSKVKTADLKTESRTQGLEHTKKRLEEHLKSLGAENTQEVNCSETANRNDDTAESNVETANENDETTNKNAETTNENAKIANELESGKMKTVSTSAKDIGNKSMSQTCISSYFMNNKKTGSIRDKAVSNESPRTNGNCKSVSSNNVQAKKTIHPSAQVSKSSKTAQVPKAARRQRNVQGQSKKECPFYKKIPDTCFTVDAFCYGDIPGCKAYFLSHFHSDHYRGLTKNFRGKIYCSKITANLVSSQLRVDSVNIVILPMDEEIIVHDVEVTLLDANHCPGSVMFLFQLRNGERILHVGDFRADSSMFSHKCLSHKVVNSLYLDTTYCDPAYTFPPQGDVISYVVDTATQFLKQHPHSLIACGTYTIGKERVFKAIAGSLKLKVGVTKQKWKVLSCLEDEELMSMLTTNYDDAQLHVLPLGSFNCKKLNEHLIRCKEQGFQHLLAFKPTGWTFSSKTASLNEIKPFISGSVTMYAVPYSEHSSFQELGDFVRRLQPKKIIPTVNMGSQKSRDTMNEHFESWVK